MNLNTLILLYILCRNFFFILISPFRMNNPQENENKELAG